MITAVPPDLTGLEPRYRRKPPVALWGLAALAVVFSALTVADVLDDRSLWKLAVDVLTVSIMALGLVLGFVRPPTVALDRDGIRVSGDLRQRVLRWDEVEEVKPSPSGRCPRAWLASGRSVPLLGMPVEAGERLQAALQRRDPA